MINRETIITKNPDDTCSLAERLLKSLPDRRVFALYGDLGSGKTCFVQGMAMALGINQRITSPTFTIANEYRAERPLYHIDLYRLHGAQDALNIGLDEYLESDGITAVEWAERAEELMPADTVRIKFETMADPLQRKITVLS